MSHTISLTVTRTDDQWDITHIDAALATRRFRPHPDTTITEALREAEAMASGEVLWRVTDDGLEAVVHSAVTGWPMPAASPAMHTAEEFRAALLDHLQRAELQTLGLGPYDGAVADLIRELVGNFEIPEEG